MTTPKICELAKEAITRILTATKHQLSLDDFDDIAQLNEVARRAMTPNEPHAYRLLARPAEVGTTGILLHPSTISRAWWISDHAHRLFPEEVRLLAAVVYALKVEDPRVLYSLSDSELISEVMEVVKLLDVMPSELLATMEKVLDIPGATGEGDGAGAEPSMIYGPVIAALLREYGGTPDLWLHDTGLETIKTLLEDLRVKVESDNEQVAASAGHKHFARLYLDSMAALRDKEAELMVKWGDPA